MATTWVVIAVETAVGMAVAGTATAWLRARLAADREPAAVVVQTTDH